jgi:hypothetical protein
MRGHFIPLPSGKTVSQCPALSARRTIHAVSLDPICLKNARACADPIRPSDHAQMKAQRQHLWGRSRFSVAFVERKLVAKKNRWRGLFWI